MIIIYMTDKANLNLLQAQSITSDSGYKRPDKTYQDKLTYDEIKEKLKNYVKVKDLTTIPLNTHIRYIERKINPLTQKMETKFRLGGYLVNKKNVDKYIVLSNGRVKWSVQVPSTVFYMSTKQMEEDSVLTEKEKNKYEKQIEELKLMIAEQELKIKKLKEKNKELKNKK
jgi:hypothetical protein